MPHQGTFAPPGTSAAAGPHWAAADGKDKEPGCPRWAGGITAVDPEVSAIGGGCRMSASSPPQFNPVNSALVHEELLLDISMVLEHGKSVGPSFLHSFGTVAEAVVLHDRVF